MLYVGVEAGGYAQLCNVCPLDRIEPHTTVYIVAWENALPNTTSASIYRRTGGLVRLCWEHLDELAVLIAEVL